MACEWISLDAMDISGELQLDVVSIKLSSVAAIGKRTELYACSGP